MRKSLPLAALTALAVAASADAALADAVSDYPSTARGPSAVVAPASSTQREPDAISITEYKASGATHSPAVSVTRSVPNDGGLETGWIVLIAGGSALLAAGAGYAGGRHALGRHTVVARG
jgi:hypothetical protein